MRGSQRPAALTVARLGLMVAVAFVLSYLEVILPLPTGLPGVKLGLCHIVVVFALYRMGKRAALLITCVRVALAALLFGNAVSWAYSLTGALLSLGCMVLLTIRPAVARRFSTVGVSVTGAVLHNLGQIVCAAFLMGTTHLIWYLPVLLVAGCVSGTIIGVVAALAVRGVPTFKGGRKDE